MPQVSTRKHALTQKDRLGCVKSVRDPPTILIIAVDISRPISVVLSKSGLGYGVFVSPRARRRHLPYRDYTQCPLRSLYRGLASYFYVLWLHLLIAIPVLFYASTRMCVAVSLSELYHLSHTASELWTLLDSRCRFTSLDSPSSSKFTQYVNLVGCAPEPFSVSPCH